MGGAWDIETLDLDSWCPGHPRNRSLSIYFDRVQGDAYAPPSWVRVRVPMAQVPWRVLINLESKCETFLGSPN